MFESSTKGAKQDIHICNIYCTLYIHRQCSFFYIKIKISSWQWAQFFGLFFCCIIETGDSRNTSSQGQSSHRGSIPMKHDTTQDHPLPFQTLEWYHCITSGQSHSFPQRQWKSSADIQMFCGIQHHLNNPLALSRSQQPLQMYARDTF